MNETDPDLREMFAEERSALCTTLDTLLTTTLPRLLLPSPSTASLPTVISLNAGVGGSESALFVEELARMYTRFAEKRGWTIEVISKVDGPMGKGGGGLREVTMKFDSGEAAKWAEEGEEAEVFGLLQWEKGVHRVQRVPATETMGRIHTSTVAVVVSCLPCPASTLTVRSLLYRARVLGLHRDYLLIQKGPPHLS
jgi:peptide chain release factor 1